MCVLDCGNPFYMAEPAIDKAPFTIWVIAHFHIVLYALALLITELVRYKRLGKEFSHA